MPQHRCLPSKNMIHSVKVASYFARAAEFGIESAGYKINMAGVTNRKRATVKALVDIHIRNFATSGVDLVLGCGHFMNALIGEDDSILGFTAFGVDGGEIMSAVQIAMIAGLPYTALRDAILTHPTVAEGLIVLFSSVTTVVEIH